MTSPAAQWSLVAVWSGAGPVFREIAADGDGWLLGRESLADDRVSRRHCRVSRETDEWKIEDLGSANGTYVDGERIDGVVGRREVSAIQIGRTLVVPIAAPPEVPRVLTRTAEAFVGPGLYPAWAATAEAAAAGRHLCMLGRRGCGFERLAAHYLRAWKSGGRLSTVRLDRATPASKAAELPAGAVLVTSSLDMQAHARWSDNIPPLIAETREAAAEILRAGRTKLRGRDLSGYASRGLESVIHEPIPAPAGELRRPMAPLRDRERFAALVRAHAGDRAKIAEELGVTVEAVAQWMRRHALADD